MLKDNTTNENFSSYSNGGYAGKVNFNTIAAPNYLTNEAYKTLRTNILFSGNNIKTILLTSARENEGKSTICAELAKSLAETEKKVLLLDSDMRKSVLLRRNAKARSFYGLSEYLSDQTEFSNILYNTQDPYFDVIFSGRFPPNPVELLSSPKFKDLLTFLKERYDYIIIDSPPLGRVIDSAVIAAQCDASVIVITPGKIPISEAADVKEQLLKSGSRILGVVLNDIDSKNSKYYKKSYKNYEYK